MTLLSALSLLAPAPLLAVAALAALRPGRRPGLLPVVAEASTIVSLLLAGLGLWQTVAAGATDTVVSFGPFALAQDILSATMLLLVSFVGWAVVRYSRTYVDGEEREGAFHGYILLTLATVMLLVKAGNIVTLVLAFAAVGHGLGKLLLFYPGRPEARRAATKFSLIWGAADGLLVFAAILFWVSFGTVDFTAMSTAAASETSFTAHAAVLLLVMAVLLKTAAFPLHGWLTEVMEAPTPVSALLHAGIINAGGFVLIRMADVVQASPIAMALLVLAGGFTALFGAMVMLTQSAVKTALAWSTISQMGFMLLQCGLGLWALALLHIIAHSLYKAHAFLSSGGAVAAVQQTRRPGPVAAPSLMAVVKSFGLALCLYGLVALAFTLAVGPKSPQALALGTILVFGVAYLVAQGLAGAAPKALMIRTVAASVAAAVSYFSFHILAGGLWGSALPQAPLAGPLEWCLLALAIASFGLVAFAQSLFPLWAHHPATAGWRVHFANGLYLNAILDRLIGGFKLSQPQSSSN